MAHQIRFTAPVRLFGANVSNQKSRFYFFDYDKMIQVESINYWPEIGYDFIWNGYKFEHVSEDFIEVR